MISEETKKSYEVTIGIECHVQLKTKTKLFSGAGNDAREAAPNTLVNHIDFGLPGALPVLNKEAVRLASKAAFALGSVPQKFSKFDRKHYFYPDLPMGYQITQYDEPIVLGGSVEIEVEGEKKIIGITRAHLEADAGKSTHPAGKDYSLVDLNRAGTPLLEIVSEPDMHSAAEAKAYCKELWLRMKYAEVSDVSLFYGNMRFDVNVSVSKTGELGTRSETKNLNSFRSVEKAIEYEVNRQIELLEKGEKVVQETRGWLDDKQKTVSQRTKENADDYRYMPDPDLPPVVLDDKFIEQVKAEMPVLPSEWRKRLTSLGLDTAQVETLLDAHTEFPNVDFLGQVEESLDDPDFARFLVNNHINITVPHYRKGSSFTVIELLPANKVLYQLINANKLNSTNAKLALVESIESGEDINVIIEEKNLLQVSDEEEITKIVEQVLKENEQAASDVKNGETKAIGFLVGQVMKLSQGKANPALAQQLIKKQLEA